ncbi:hypothetical protein D3C78_1707090 [compost metagenome]
MQVCPDGEVDIQPAGERDRQFRVQPGALIAAAAPRDDQLAVTGFSGIAEKVAVQCLDVLCCRWQGKPVVGPLAEALGYTVALIQPSLLKRTAWPW